MPDLSTPAQDTTEAGLDEDAVLATALTVWSYKQGEVVSLMIHLGDRLGLYRSMDGAGPLTAAELADRTSLKERWLLEWLRSQGAAQLLVTSDGEHFELTPEAASVLADEHGSLWFAAGAFSGAAAPTDVLDDLADAFRTGRGLPYDALGETTAHATARMLGPWARLALIPAILPILDGVVDKLEQGIQVADLGCGAGVAVLTMAEAFPASTFTGFDSSAHAIEKARTAATTMGLENVSFEIATSDDLPDTPTYDLVLSFDCLHDMTFPATAISDVHRALTPDGTYLIKDIRAGATWQENLKNPLLAMMYGQSVTVCMSSALSENGGAGLGTLGLHPELAEQMCREAGFTSFVQHDVGDPANLYYEVRSQDRGR